MSTTFATELGVKVSWDDSRVHAGIPRTQNEIRGFVSNVKSTITQGIGQALGQMGFQSVVQGIKAVGLQMLNTNADFEDFNTQFEVLLGSAEKAKGFYKELNAFALKTPFEIGELANASQVMLSFGIDVKKVMPFMKQIGDVSLGNKQKFSSLALAFAQVQATGRLMGQDLLQMINQGFNPLTIISEKTGISMADLKKKMEDGAISSQMVADAFKIATSEGGRFYQGMEKGSQTFNGLKSTAMDAINAIVREIGEPFFAAAKKGLVKFIDYIGSDTGKAAIKNMVLIAAKGAVIATTLLGLAKGASMLSGLAPIFSAISGSLVTMAGSSGALIGMSKGATLAAGAMGYLKAAVSALMGPVGIAIAIITALVTAYTTNFAGFRDFVNGLVSEIGAFFNEMAGELRSFLNENTWIIDLVKQYWEQLKAWWTVLFKTLMDVVAGAWGIIKNVIRLGFDYISGLISFWRKVFQGDWKGAWEVAKETLQKVWNDFVLIIWNAILAILKILDNFADYFAKAFGIDFTGLDGAINAAKSIIQEYEAAVKSTHAEVRKEVRKTAEEQKKANKETFSQAAFGALDSKAKGRGKKGTGSDKQSNITQDLLLSLAAGIRTPAGKASCAFFASEMLKETGVQIKGTGGAKALIDQVKKAGGYEVSASQAKAGDLVYYYGKNYGEAKDSKGNGYHVGIYRGDGYVIDSSSGRKRSKQRLGNSAKFVRPQREGKYSNVDETSVKSIEEYNNALKEQQVLVERHKQSMMDLWREQLRLNGAKQSAIFQWEYERGAYPELTKAQFEQRLEAMKYNEQLADQIRGKEALAIAQSKAKQDIEDYVSSLRKELVYGEAVTETEKLLVALREKQLKTSSVFQTMYLVGMAAAVDTVRKAREGTAAYAKALEEVDRQLAAISMSAKDAAIAEMKLQGMTQEQAETIWGKKERLAGLEAYREYMKEIAADMLELGGNADEAAISILMLEKSMTREQAEDVVYGKKRIAGLKAYKEHLKDLNKEMLELTLSRREWMIQELMISEQMTRAQAEEIVKRKENIERLKEYKKVIEEIVEKTVDAFVDALFELDKGWKNFFQGLLDSFRAILRDMVKAYLRSQFFKILMKFVNPGKGGSDDSEDSGTTGNLITAGASIAGSFASGGYMNARSTYLVGENGPELITPAANSYVLNNSKTSSLLNQRSAATTTGMTINFGGMHVTGVQDTVGFKKNMAQMELEVIRMLERAKRRS